MPVARPQSIAITGLLLGLVIGTCAVDPAVATPAAGPVVVTVREADGKPLPWAVVTLQPTSGQGLGNWTASPPVMTQEGMLFDPFVLAVPVGAEVSFPNLDDIRHHVYSFSAARRFELRLYGKDETKLVAFDKPGIVALGCNIHDNMLSYICVTEAPVQAVTDADGRATFSGLPEGTWDLGVWHPDLAGEPPALRPFEIGADGGDDPELVLELRPLRRRQSPPRGGRY